MEAVSSRCPALRTHPCEVSMRRRTLVLPILLLAGSSAAGQAPAPLAFPSQPPPLPGLPPSAPATPAPPTATAAGPVEDLETFDGQAASMEWAGHHWRVTVGEKVLKD